MRHFLIIQLLLCIAQIITAHDFSGSGTINELRDGDLLFFAPASGNAITQVTTSDSCRPEIDHVAIFHHTTSGDSIIEAVHSGVSATPVDSALVRADRCKYRIYAGRIIGDFDAAQSISRAKKHIGKPYDFYFEPNDSAIYCSELVQIAYIDHQGKAIFNTIPMSFHTPDGKILQYWIDYYHRAGKQVPEGAPGTNPGQLIRSPKVEILFTLNANH